jgi:MinD-like ATPase involved in chromosome partitioning or flagellar assembly
MPTIPFLSPKGGVGETTAALLFATLLAKIDCVTLIDADPNRPIEDRASGDNVPPRLTVISDIEEETITEAIQDAASKSTFVIFDLEGAVSKVVMQSERMTRRSIPFAVSLTRTAAMDGRVARLIFRGRFRKPASCQRSASTKDNLGPMA